MNAHQRRVAKRKGLGKLTPHDRAEVKHFSEFLKDASKLSPQALVDKHGEYMGLNEKPVKQGQSA